MVQYLFIFLAIFLMQMNPIQASAKGKPHSHQGIIEPYDGKLLPVTITADQSKKLDKGDSVQYNERSGKSGRGVVIQDINASTLICMNKIRDLESYNKMVPHVKNVDIYERQQFQNGTSKTGAKFDIGLLGMRFGYFLLLTHEPKYNTLTWTLDYRHSSDLDDNVGHWQVMQHPSKNGWSRILYSTKIKLFSWIPEFVINFLTSKALTESTSWVKRESEKAQRIKAEEDALAAASAANATKKLPTWLTTKGGFKARLEKVKLDLANQKKNFSSSWNGFVGGGKLQFFKRF